MRKKQKQLLVIFSMMITLLFSGCGTTNTAINGTDTSKISTESNDTKNTEEITSNEELTDKNEEQSTSSFDLGSIPEYTGTPYTVIHDNVPYFTGEELSETDSFESYSDLDDLGRCGVAYANVGQDLMPTEKRGAIGSVKPTGWHTVKYDCVDGKYLYNRCHLIGYQLTAENANEKNLVTGTRYLNVDGMLPFENMAADYVKETGNHVLYRVTPEFNGNELVCRGVLMEAESVEDKGEGVKFCVYVYNVQPGVTIDYATGDSSLGDSTSVITDTPAAGDTSNSAATSNNDYTDSDTTSSSDTTETYIINENTRKFHKPSCSSVSKMSETNKKEYTGSRDELISEDYEACKNCNP